MKPDMNRFHLQIEYQFVNHLDVVIRVVPVVRSHSCFPILPVIPAQDVSELPRQLLQHLQEPLAW